MSHRLFTPVAQFHSPCSDDGDFVPYSSIPIFTTRLPLVK